MDEQKSENNLEGSSFLGFDSRFMGKKSSKNSEISNFGGKSNYVYSSRFQTLSMTVETESF